MASARGRRAGAPPTSQHGTLGDFWLMATMATMATLVADLLKNLHLENLVGCLLPPTSQPSLFYFQFQFRGGHRLRPAKEPTSGTGWALGRAWEV